MASVHTRPRVTMMMTFKYCISERLKLEGEAENMSVCTKRVREA